MTAATAARVAPPRRSPTAHTVHRLAVALLRMAGWFWGIALLAVVVGNVIGWVAAGGTDVSIAAYARQASTWFPFSLAIMLVAAYLRVHVASGMTRRTFVRAALVVEVAAGLAYGVVLTTLIVLERAVHDALGWDSVITEVGLARESSPAWVLLVELAVPFVLANLSGLLVGAVYQRVGGRWGTLLLPLTVAPVALAFFAAGARLMEVPGVWSSASELQFLALSTGLYVALGVATAVAFALVARRLPVGAKP